MLTEAHQAFWKLAATLHWPRTIVAGGVAIAVIAFCAVFGRFELTLGSGPHLFYCPLCGGTRAVHAFWGGRVFEALSYNPLLVLAMPVIVYFFWAITAIWVAGYYPFGFRNPFTWVHNWLIGAGLIAVTYMALRNIPMWPWTLLAP